MNLLLDTCALIWAISEPERLPDGVRHALEEPGAVVSVSPISCAEIACAVASGRIAIEGHWRSWFRRHVEANGWTSIAIDLDVVEEAYSLPEPFHRDPADRILVATARLARMPIVTADRRILEYPHVQTLW